MLTAAMAGTPQPWGRAHPLKDRPGEHGKAETEGERRTREARQGGAQPVSKIRATMPMVIIAGRQSQVEFNQRANGETVTGATPIPAETSDAARLRLVTSQHRRGGDHRREEGVCGKP
jgi:hypothetical protein